MCKVRNIAYVCGHSMSFRLSICGGTYTHLSRRAREKRASCIGSALITIRSQAVCGMCARTAREKELNDEIAALKMSLAKPDVDAWTAEIPEEVTAAESKRDQELYLLDKRFPNGQVKRTTRPEKGLGASRPANRKSILRNEVTPDAVVLTWEVNPFAVSASWDDWGDDYTRLEDEVAENQAAQEAAGITVSWGPWGGQEENEHAELEEDELSRAREDASDGPVVEVDDYKAKDAEFWNAWEATEKLCTEPKPLLEQLAVMPQSTNIVITPHLEPELARDTLHAKENARPTKGVRPRNTSADSRPANQHGPPPASHESSVVSSRDGNRARKEAPPWHGYRSMGPQLLISL